ncbi:MAG: hypothetical protein CND29_01165 [Marine Group II euryarchaeote MED-G36]|nr:MAG: hypothetical protein CND29_01165 [Marine Group II euryarchaeote MED-G36]
MAGSNIGARLQHPRRSLGNRHRSQAEKFLTLSKTDSSNLKWAEQSARQAVLHDFTQPENWRILLETKLANSDKIGMRAVLDELFIVLGRDPELLQQLNEVDLLISGRNLMDAAFLIDPIDPDKWWENTQSKEEVEAFISRVRELDFTDARANILFARRMERLLENGYEEEYLELTAKLLAQRPSNHEAWTKMGRLHERRKESDKAWFCYDQAQTHMPSIKVRDEFKQRMSARIDGQDAKPWNAPDIDDRVEFLRRMQILAAPASANTEDIEMDILSKESEFNRAKRLYKGGRISEAFFIARRLAAEGDSEALDLANQIKGEMNEE